MRQRDRGRPHGLDPRRPATAIRQRSGDCLPRRRLDPVDRRAGPAADQSASSVSTIGTLSAASAVDSTMLAATGACIVSNSRAIR